MTTCLRPTPVVLFIPGAFSVTSAALGLGLWRFPSYTLAVISVCVAAFLAFLYVILWIDGSLGSPWTILFPLMPGAAAILTLINLARLDRTQGPSRSRTLKRWFGRGDDRSLALEAHHGPERRPGSL